MRLAVAFRSLPRPSSPVEPSHPPDSMGASYLYLGPMTASLVEGRKEGRVSVNTSPTYLRCDMQLA